MRKVHGWAIGAVVAAVLTGGTVAQAYDLFWTGAAATNDWATGGNWYNAVPYNASFPPEPGITVYITDAAVSADVVLYSGAWTIGDFSLQANTSGAGTSASLTIKSGSTLNSQANFDLGYTSGSEMATLTVEEGATVNVSGYFGGGRPGAHLANVFGTVNTNALTIGGADFVNLGETGVITATGNLVSDLNTSWIPGGLFYASGGYDVVGVYDSGTNKTTISAVAVPEPAAIGLAFAGLAGMMMRRNRR